MIELKVASCFELEKVLSGKSNKLFYSKGEADAVIAELKDIIEKNQTAYYVDLGIVAKDCEKLKAREDVLVTDNRDLLEKIKMLEELLRENAEHFKRNEMQIIEASDKLKAENERLNRELEHVKNGDCINTCDVVEKHVKEELKAKRALWMARAERAKERQNYESGCRSDGWVRRENMWLEVECLCRHKAEEYK